MKTKAIGYITPKTVVEATERKRVLGKEILELQRQLGSRNVRQNGSRLDGVEYWQWRDTTVERVQAIQTELGLLRDWLRDNHAKAKQTDGIAFIRNGMNGICSYIDALTVYAEHLRQRLAKYEKDLPDAPGFGVDWWREQT